MCPFLLQRDRESDYDWFLEIKPPAGRRGKFEVYEEEKKREDQEGVLQVHSGVQCTHTVIPQAAGNAVCWLCDSFTCVVAQLIKV